MKQKISLRLSPSKIGQYYEKRCAKNLVSVGLSEKDKESLGWSKDIDEPSAAANAGDLWEQEICEKLKADPDITFIELPHDSKEKSQSIKPTVDILKKLKKDDSPTYIYQACVSVTDSFKTKYLDAFEEYDFEVTFSKSMFPDFILAEYIESKGKFRLTLIDAKNAERIKIGAELQIAFYVELLKSIIRDEKIDNCYVNEKEGIVWNKERVTHALLPHVFELRDALAEIETFFHETLSEVCSTVDQSNDGEDLFEKLKYHVSQKCEYCSNFESCKEFCKKKKSVRILPYITENANNKLDECITAGVLKDDSWSSVKKLLKGKDYRALTDDCNYWKNIRNDLDAYESGLKALWKDKKDVYPKKGSTFSFPVGQNFSLFLTAQQDVDTGRIYAYAWTLRQGKDIDLYADGLNKNGYVDIKSPPNDSEGISRYSGAVVAENNTEKEFDRIDRLFVEHIYEFLESIAGYPDDRLHKLQCYVMDDYERLNIESSLFNMLENLDPELEQDLLEKVMTILFWTQGERIVTDSDEQPEECIENPVSVITTALSQLYVMPQAISYNLIHTSEYYSPDYKFTDGDDYYLGKLSNVVKGMPIVYIWNSKDRTKTDKKTKQNKIESLKKHLLKRLDIENTIVGKIQQDARNGNIVLSEWPAYYRMQKKVHEGFPEIAKLDFENRYEQLLTYHQIRNGRMKGVDNAISEGSILSLEHIGGYKYKILNYESYNGRDWFQSCICEDTVTNREHILRLKDLQYNRKKTILMHTMSVKNLHGDWIPVFYMASMDTKPVISDEGDHGEVSFVAKNEDFTPVPGKKYLMFEVYKDFNSSKTAAGLVNLHVRPELLSPADLSGSTGFKFTKAAEKICKKYWDCDGHEFSTSQLAAFKHLFERKLTVLVGPPAAGKTDFIARAVITLSHYYREKEGRDIKVLISAMSHSATENVLIKIKKMLTKAPELGKNLSVYKADSADDEQTLFQYYVGLFESSKMRSLLAKDEIGIFGMTGYSAFKSFMKYGDPPAFDLIVIDEASQLRTMDAFLQLECSGENTRFLLVGDDDQLPPIIGGNYKAKKGEKYIYGSIFRMFLTALGDDHEDVVHLSDNFRMNNILCRYSAEKIYGPEYKASISSIAKQTIKLDARIGDKLMNFMLDPKYPLVFCKLTGTSKEQKEAEIEIVRSLVRALYDHIQNADGILARDYGNFWREYKGVDGACGIISPHHEHINRLRTRISDDLGIKRSDVYIGTVDKLQGKERQVVIVSYGVSQSEKINNESEFIFSRNRFNVSITRGKAKTIVLLSDAIADSNITTNVLKTTDEDVCKGIDFIHGFSDYMLREEVSEEAKTLTMKYMDGDVELQVVKKKLRVH